MYMLHDGTCRSLLESVLLVHSPAAGSRPRRSRCACALSLLSAARSQPGACCAALENVSAISLFVVIYTRGATGASVDYASSRPAC